MHEVTHARCEWCGVPHAQTALCAPRLKVSRRTFLFLGSAGVVGAVLGASALASPLEKWGEMPAWDTMAVFTGGDGWVRFDKRTLIARIRITPEAIQDSVHTKRAFVAACRDEWARLVKGAW